MSQILTSGLGAYKVLARWVIESVLFIVEGDYVVQCMRHAGWLTALPHHSPQLADWMLSLVWIQGCELRKIAGNLYADDQFIILKLFFINH